MLVYFFPHSILEFKKQKLSILDVLSESAVKFKDMSKGLWGGKSKCQYEKYFLFMRRKNILLKAFVTNYSLRVSQVYPTVVISTLFQKQNFLLNNWNFLSSCGQINDLEFTLQILQKQWTFFDRHIEDTITKNMSTSFWAMSVDTMHIIPYLLISFFVQMHL